MSSSTIFEVPLASSEYDISLGNVMVHDLTAIPAASTQMMSIPILRQKLSVNTIPAGQFLIFKKPPNTNIDILEAGDIAQGWFNESKFIKAVYISGPVTDLDSWNILEEMDF